MAVLRDDLEAVEVGAHLAHVVDHGGDPKDGGMTTIVLEAVTTFFSISYDELKQQQKLENRSQLTNIVCLMSILYERGSKHKR